MAFLRFPGWSFGFCLACPPFLGRDRKALPYRPSEWMHQRGFSGKKKFQLQFESRSRASTGRRQKQRILLVMEDFWSQRPQTEQSVANFERVITGVVCASGDRQSKKRTEYDTQLQKETKSKVQAAAGSIPSGLLVDGRMTDILCQNLAVYSMRSWRICPRSSRLVAAFKTGYLVKASEAL